MANTYQIPTNINGRPPQPVDAGYYAFIQFDPDDSAPDYIGLNLDVSATDTASDWKVYKFTYSSGNTTKIQLAYGSWSGRSGLFS